MTIWQWIYAYLMLLYSLVAVMVVYSLFLAPAAIAIYLIYRIIKRWRK